MQKKYPLKDVRGIKSDLRKELLGLIHQEYEVRYEGDRIFRLVNYIIDMFLDESAPTRVKVSESTIANKVADEVDEYEEYDEYDEYWDQDIATGKLLAFTRRCLNQGYRTIRRGRQSEQYDGLRAKRKPS